MIVGLMLAVRAPEPTFGPRPPPPPTWAPPRADEADPSDPLPERVADDPDPVGRARRRAVRGVAIGLGVAAGVAGTLAGGYVVALLAMDCSRGCEA